jgi:hypothetical protein
VSASTTRFWAGMGIFLFAWLMAVGGMLLFNYVMERC